MKRRPSRRRRSRCGSALSVMNSQIGCGLEQITLKYLLRLMLSITLSMTTDLRHQAEAGKQRRFDAEHKKGGKRNERVRKEQCAPDVDARVLF